MRSTWLGLAFTRLRYLTDFQENYKCNSCFVTILNDIQVKYCRLDERASTNKLFSLIKMTKWHAHVVHMAKHKFLVALSSVDQISLKFIVNSDLLVLL